MSNPPPSILAGAASKWRNALRAIFPDRSYVNLGIGIPELVAKYVPPGREFVYHTENGLLGMGPAAEPGQEDPELINAGKKSVTANPGASFLPSWRQLRHDPRGTY